MKELTIVVRPFRAEAVLRALDEAGLDGVVREAKGYSRQKGYLERYLGSEFSMASPSVLKRFFGMTLPGNCAPPASGSTTLIATPEPVTLLEKSPPRSPVVGTVMLRTPCGRNWRWNSSLTKKNSFGFFIS